MVDGQDAQSAGDGLPGRGKDLENGAPGVPVPRAASSPATFADSPEALAPATPLGKDGWPVRDPDAGGGPAATDVGMPGTIVAACVVLAIGGLISLVKSASLGPVHIVFAGLDVLSIVLMAQGRGAGRVLAALGCGLSIVFGLMALASHVLDIGLPFNLLVIVCLFTGSATEYFEAHAQRRAGAGAPGAQQTA